MDTVRRGGLGAFAAGFKENAALLATVRRRRRETARHRGQTPFLHVGFDEYEAHLSEIDVYRTWSVSPDGGKEVLGLESMAGVIEFLSVSSKEDCPCPWSIANPNHITLYIDGPVSGGVKGLVVSAVSWRQIRNG